jgi:Protein of unknown function (DUF3105)
MRHLGAWGYRSLTGCVLAALLVAGAGLLTEGCSDSPASGDAGAGGTSTSSSGATGGNAADAGMQTVVLHPDAKPLSGESECKVEITTGIQWGDIAHVPVCTQVQYSTSPPTWGDHWLIWAAYKKYTTPLPKEMYVHNHEHGGVLLSYRCPNGCPEVVSALEKVFDDVPEDPLCFKIPGGPKTRMVMAPDPEAVAPIVLSAWNAHYKATCIDTASLSKFVSEVYGHGTEELCDEGVDLGDPSQGFLDCGDAGPGDGG